MYYFKSKKNMPSLRKLRPFFTVLLLILMSSISITTNQALALPVSLTTALANTKCQFTVPANAPNPAVTALHIASSTPCSNVTVGTTDATFTAQAPLMPVVVGAGGTLKLQDQPMTLYANSFLIQNGGTMQAGTAAQPITNQITIVMAGNASAALPPHATGGTPIVNTTNNTPNARDITVMDGGALKLYGGKGLSATPDGTHNNPATNPAFINTVEGTKSWTYLAVPAGPSSYSDAENVSAPVPTTAPDTTLTLSTTVDWQVGDWVSVATTSFSSHQTEIVQICAITSVPNPDPKASALDLPLNVSQITLRNGTNCTATPNNTPLKHYHYGGLAPTPGFFPANTTQSVVSGGNPIDVSYQAKSFYDDHHRNYGIDERAEVALLSRNIKLTSVAGQAADANNFIGGHLVAMVSDTGKPAPILQLVGVEIEKFGQGLVGRYPVHLHKLPQYQITEAANAGDGNIAISSSTVPANGTVVTISGVQGNTAANVRSWPVTKTNTSAGTFELKDLASKGAYTSGGIWTHATILIQDVSVHHSYNKCYVVHGTGNADFYNNVCVRTVGQGAYLEDGANITGNQFMRNFIAGTMAAQTTYSYPQKNGSLYWDGDNLLFSHWPAGIISKATNTSPIVVSSSAVPANGSQVTISGAQGNTAADGTWTVTNANPSASTFALASTGNGTSATGGTFQVSGSITSTTATHPIVVSSSTVPANGSQVTISGTGTAAAGTWTVKNAKPIVGTFELKGSKGTKTFTAPTWSTGGLNVITSMSQDSTTGLIIIHTQSLTFAGTKVTISGTNTQADGTWTATNVIAGPPSFQLAN